MNTGILIAVLAYEIILILGVGLWLARREANQPKHKGDFALAGRNLPVPLVAITLALTVLGTAHILGVFAMVGGVGAAAVWFSIAHVILLVIVCLSTGLWVRRLGLTTVPEILDMLYGRKTRLFVSCTMASIIFDIFKISKLAKGLGAVSVEIQSTTKSTTTNTANSTDVTQTIDIEVDESVYVGCISV